MYIYVCEIHHQQPYYKVNTNQPQYTHLKRIKKTIQNYIETKYIVYYIFIYVKQKLPSLWIRS